MTEIVNRRIESTHLYMASNPEHVNTAAVLGITASCIASYLGSNSGSAIAAGAAIAASTLYLMNTLTKPNLTYAVGQASGVVVEVKVLETKASLEEIAWNTFAQSHNQATHNEDLYAAAALAQVVLSKVSDPETAGATAGSIMNDLGNDEDNEVTVSQALLAVAITAGAAALYSGGNPSEARKAALTSIKTELNKIEAISHLIDNPNFIQQCKNIGKMAEVNEHNPAQISQSISSLIEIWETNPPKILSANLPLN